MTNNLAHSSRHSQKSETQNQKNIFRYRLADLRSLLRVFEQLSNTMTRQVMPLVRQPKTA